MADRCESCRRTIGSGAGECSDHDDLECQQFAAIYQRMYAVLRPIILDDPPHDGFDFSAIFGGQPVNRLRGDNYARS